MTFLYKKNSGLKVPCFFFFLNANEKKEKGTLWSCFKSLNEI